MGQAVAQAHGRAVGRVWRSAHPEQAEDETGSSDARLIDGLRRGAPAAFAGLHERYATGIYNLALRVVRHGPDAEDITQDVLIRAFERLPQDREVLLRPWLYRITLNRCYDHLRGSSRRPLPVAEGADAPSSVDPYEQSELQQLLEAAIGDLTRRQRAALLLKDVHGLSLVEVAACLDLTPGSVEVLLARARRAFRASFEERCVAAGRPLPRSAGGLAALPLLSLPASLGAPALPLPIASPGHMSPAQMPPTMSPLPQVPPAVALCPPLTVAAGSGISAVLGLPASVKTAVLIAAAAATVGTAEIAVTQPDQRPPRPAAGVAAVVVQAPVVVVPTNTMSGHPKATPSPSLKPSPSAPAPSASPTSTSLPSPAATDVADSTTAASPLGISTPMPDPSATPTPVATPTDEPPPVATPTADPLPSVSPSPNPSPSTSLAPEASATTPPLFRAP